MAENNTIQDGVFFTIAEVANQIGVVPTTIRNWEKQGLFVAKRSESGYRIYSMADIEYLRGIKRHSKDEGFGISAIKKLYTRPVNHIIPQKKEEEEQVSKKLLSQKWKDCRMQRGYLLDDVAQKIGISSSYMSKIENGQANVSYAVLQKLAAFYGENILYYISDSEVENHLVRKDEGEVFSIGIDGISVESVVSLKKHTLSSMIYTAEPGTGRMSPSSHSGEEFIHVLAGRVSIMLREQEYILKSGDSLSFRSTEPHSWYNYGKTQARILWVYTPLVQEH
jgi:DNA-binding transcriptional MerR regulator/quercetin dioxygenase-like cupin family protein